MFKFFKRRKAKGKAPPDANDSPMHMNIPGTTVAFEEAMASSSSTVTIEQPYATYADKFIRRMSQHPDANFSVTPTG
eukprot:817382-Prorocentrum_minimum.AAC.1